MSAPRLQIRHLQVRRGTRTLVRELNADLLPGQLWGILGENGSGKTSLLHVLAGLDTPAQGDVLLESRPLRQWPRKALAQRLGLLLQQTQDVFPLRVEEAVAAGLFPHRPFWSMRHTEDQQRIQEALRQVSLETQAERFLQDLSGGERQRLAIATLLVQAPRLFLLDEPCNHLDVRHQVRILDHFNQLTRDGHSLVMAIHDVNLAARYCSHLILLFPSGEVQVGPTAQLLTEQNLEALFSHPIREVSDGRVQLWTPE